MDGYSHKARPALGGRIALAVLSCALGGCASFNSGIDPSGQRIFLAPESQVVQQSQVIPGIAAPQARVVLSPRQVIAPVGSEVVMIAGVCGGDGFLTSGERVEWMLEPQSAGQFVTMGGRGDWFAWRSPSNTPRKVDNRYAIGSTVYRSVNITRGTPDPADDVTVQSGQAWITVTSPVEGTSEVTAFAPGVTGWAFRKTSATIHWIDAQWTFPPPAINPVGQPHIFTTSITRNSNGAPLAGWIVRYEVLDGPPAGFAPDGAQVIEVPTDELGQASVEISQSAPQSGASRVAIQIVRPPLLGSARTGRLVLGTGVTTKTWSAPDLGVNVTGPASAGTDGTLVYRVEVSNPGDLPTRDVGVSVEVPPGLTVVQTVPQVEPQNGALTWSLGTLPPQQSQTVEVHCRAEREGTYNLCAIARTSEGLSARDCAATTVAAIAAPPVVTPTPIPPAESPAARPTVELVVEGPEAAQVGQTVRYQATVINRGAASATGLVISDRFEEGLRHAVAASPIERDLDPLGPGQSQAIFITFRVTKSGQLCHDVDVTRDGQVLAQKRVCLSATAAPAEPPPVVPGPRGKAALEVRKTGPREMRVGGTAEFMIVIRNSGEVPLTNLRIADRYDLPLDPVFATKGFVVGRDELVWTLDRLEVGKEHRLQVNCQCTAVAANACNQVTVTSDQMGPIADDVCLKIAPAEAGPQIPAGRPALKVSIVSLDEPVRVGGAGRYRVFVANDGSASDKDVRLTVKFPGEMTPTEEGTSGRVRPDFKGQEVQFAPIAELRSGETLEYHVRARADRAGRVKINVEAASQGFPQPLTAEQSVEILAAP